SGRTGLVSAWSSGVCSPDLEQARPLSPNGVTHDLRSLEPFPVDVDRERRQVAQVVCDAVGEERPGLLVQLARAGELRLVALGQRSEERSGGEEGSARGGSAQ